MLAQGLFDQLPGKLERGSIPNTTARKRHAPSPHPPGHERGFHSSPGLIPSRITTPDHSDTVPRASTFPKNPSVMTWKRASLTRSSSPLLDIKRRSSHEIYTLSTSDQAGMMTPDSSASSSLPYPSNQTPYCTQQNFGNTGGLPDLSAIMFPSNDPFEYPNQPMTMLENHQIEQQEATYDPNNPNTIYSGNPTTSNASYENLGVELFGPLPPYLMVGQQPSMGMQSLSGEMDMSGAGDWGPPQPTRTPGLNMDDVFGSDWKGGWMDQGGFSQ